MIRRAAWRTDAIRVSSIGRRSELGSGKYFAYWMGSSSSTTDLGITYQFNKLVGTRKNKANLLRLYSVLDMSYLPEHWETHHFLLQGP